MGKVRDQLDSLTSRPSLAQYHCVHYRMLPFRLVFCSHLHAHEHDVSKKVYALCA